MSRRVYFMRHGGTIAAMQREFDGIESPRHYTVATIDSREEGLALIAQLSELLDKVYPAKPKPKQALWVHET